MDVFFRCLIFFFVVSKAMAQSAPGAYDQGGLFAQPYQQQQQQQQQHHLPQHHQQFQQPQPGTYQFFSGPPGQLGGGGQMGGPHMGGANSNSGGSGTVLMVSGLQKSDENVTLLYNLLSFWGNIRAIKFLGKKENVAAVEYTSVEEAQNAYNLCKGVNVFFFFFSHFSLGASICGATLNVSTSRFQTVQISGSEPFAHDFSQDRTKRYTQGPQSPQYQGVMCNPSTKLHVAYLHGYSEAVIRDLFSAWGSVVNISFMPDNPTLGFVTMSSVGEACTAMCKLHGRPNPSDSNQRPLKVSFAKSGNKQQQQ
jgi:hypothetical protein